MSYTISLYTSHVKDAVLTGSIFEDLQNVSTPADLLAQFKTRIEKFCYKIESNNASCTEYIHSHLKWRIQVIVFNTQIVFSIPYCNDSENAIIKALMTAHEIANDLRLYVYDPQTDKWEIDSL